MAAARIGRVGMVAVTLAVVGGVLALAREAMELRRNGSVDWGHVALAVGIPALMYAIVRGSASRRRR